MTQPKNQSLTPSDTATITKAIPMTSCPIGSRESMISRWPLSTTDLASRYDAVSGRWVRTARHFQLNTAYQEPLLVFPVVIDLVQIEPKARVLDCGVGIGILSIALDCIKKGPGGMVFLCVTRRSLFGAVVQFLWRTWAITEQQCIARPHASQLADVGYQPVRLGFLAGLANTAFWARRTQ